MSDHSSSSFLSRANIFAGTFFAVLLFLLYQTVSLLAPFLSALLWAAIIALTLHPLYEKALLLLRGRKNLTAAIMTTATLFLVIGPAILLLAALTAQVVNVYEDAAKFIQSGRWAEVWNSLKTSFIGTVLSQPFLADLDIKGFVINGLGDLSSGIAAQLGNVLKNVLLLTINFVIMLFSLFFFFRDGDSYYRTFVEIIPFTAEQKRSIAQRLGDTFSAVVKGVFLIALLQGFMTGAGFAIFGIPFPVFWGFLASFFALLPVGGTALIWVPGAAYLLLAGQTLNGIALAVWGLVLVTMPDNILKPLLIGKKAKLPTFFLFLGILGGIKVYGILGILFGPLVVTLVTTFVQIYREEYGEGRGGDTGRASSRTKKI